MPLEATDLKHLWDMHSAASEALSFTAGLREDQYMNSLLVRRAVERSIEIVG